MLENLLAKFLIPKKTGVVSYLIGMDFAQQGDKKVEG